MTSINNLALLLFEAFEQMQQQMMKLFGGGSDSLSKGFSYGFGGGRFSGAGAVGSWEEDPNVKKKPKTTINNVKKPPPPSHASV